jgi:DNA-binding transcriptional LysR family regulator
MQDFAAARHILVSPEGDEHGVVDDALEAAGLMRRLGVVLPHMYAVPALVATTDMVATLMEGVVTGSGLTSALVVEPPPLNLPSIAFHLLWHRRTNQHPGHRWLRACIAEAATPVL